MIAPHWANWLFHLLYTPPSPSKEVFIMILTTDGTIQKCLHGFHLLISKGIKLAENVKRAHIKNKNVTH